MDLSSRRQLGVVAAVLVAVVAAGVLIIRVVGNDDDGKPAGASPLGQPAAVAAILKVEDLGEGYTAGDAEITSYLRRAPGCLAAVRRLTEAADSEVHVVRTFRGPSTAPASAVRSQISAYGSVAAARTALAALRAETSGCSGVSRELSGPEYDEQIRVRIDGASAAGKASRVPVTMSVAVVRSGSNLAIVALYEAPDGAGAGERSTARMDAVTVAAVERLAAVT